MAQGLHGVSHISYMNLQTEYASLGLVTELNVCASHDPAMVVRSVPD